MNCALVKFQGLFLKWQQVGCLLRSSDCTKPADFSTAFVQSD
jgi:hypothetical protein